MSFKIDVKDFPPEVGSWEIPIECPNCNAQNKVTLSQIKREETIRCVNCGVNIKLQDKDKSVQRGTDEVQKALDDLERALKDFGAGFH